jgi:hypothetical protein
MPGANMPIAAPLEVGFPSIGAGEASRATALCTGWALQWRHPLPANRLSFH